MWFGRWATSGDRFFGRNRGVFEWMSRDHISCYQFSVVNSFPVSVGKYPFAGMLLELVQCQIESKAEEAHA